MSVKLTLLPFTLLTAFCLQATTLSDNLNDSTYFTELIVGSTWLTAGFRTDSSHYVLSSVTVLIQQDAPGNLVAALYSNTAMQPSNDLGFQPDTQLGTLIMTETVPSSLGPVTFGGNDLRLLPNTTYWLVLSAPTSGAYEWAYEASNSGSGIGFYPSWGISDDAGRSWFTSDEQPMQMRVVGTPVSAIPEPATNWLVLLGGVGMMGAAHQLLSRRARKLPCVPASRSERARPVVTDISDPPWLPLSEDSSERDRFHTTTTGVPGNLTVCG